ncbi:MAG: UDP-N-acetylglucosamine--N-acetylmuramyl-(pentapeptide) pyrophosphoryl-undecaprenol N-acetylglucosamine transferase, partial [Burkholderiaceae bacterium]|nr:UDP-N-acetylglucosamine--N-acetylmuramyl-(pentapeptide) pyrophosphoryl-undecaprenol N-acetylglucosamine transferase [Burkholderiaceae bacterium]
IMAAGTGGHIIPGLAVAREMQRRGWSVSWLGTAQGMENKLVPPAGIALDTIGFSGLRGKGWLHTLTGGLRLLKAFGECLAILRRRSADAVLGMGGYVCFPGGMMASLLNKPLVLVNADAALLLSNRALLPVADRVAFGFDGAAAATTKNAVVTGNPVRAEIEPAALARLEPARRPRVTHQTGAAEQAEVVAAYAAAGVDAEVLPFVDDMHRRLAEADLVVCRAGAITVSELCAAGVASVLVPFVVSTTAHQRDNAVTMAQRGAAIHLPQAEATPERLAEVIAAFDRAALLAMAEKAHAFARPRAAARVADEIERLVNKVAA